MPSRAELELRAAKAGVALVANDSVLEQRVIYTEKASVASTTATTNLPTAATVQGVSGGANV
jgi:hypothetical protein